MMRTLLLLLTAATLLTSCNQNNSQKNANPKGRIRYSSDSSAGQFIVIDSANRMISSYLSSINSQHNDSDLCSLIFNADSLRHYLKDSSIVKVKIMFAHTLNYINAGGNGQNCGYQRGALTLVIAGFNSSGNYVFVQPAANVSMVLDHAIPCPDNCPLTGTAADNTLR